MLSKLRPIVPTSNLPFPRYTLPCRKVPIKGVGVFGVSPGPTPLIAYFCPEAKGQPASAGIVDSAPGAEGKVIVTKGFYRATGASAAVHGQAFCCFMHRIVFLRFKMVALRVISCCVTLVSCTEVVLQQSAIDLSSWRFTGPSILQRRPSAPLPAGASVMWSRAGVAALVLAYCDTDATNQSYYGEQKLHYLPADPARADAACTVRPARCCCDGLRACFLCFKRCNYL